MPWEVQYSGCLSELRDLMSLWVSIVQFTWEFKPPKDTDLFCGYNSGIWEMKVCSTFYIYIYIYVYIYFIYTYICVYMCVCVCVYIYIYIYCKESCFFFVTAAACSCGIASMLNSWIVTGVEGTWLVVCSSWSWSAELHRTFPFCFITRFNRNPQRILVILWQAGEPLWVHQWRHWWWWEDASTA